MKEAFEKIRKRLEDEELTSADAKAEAIIGMQGASANYYGGELRAFRRAIQIVSEVEAEYGNGWIPCGERMPRANERMKVWVTVVYPYARHTRRAYWTGWCFEWENGKQINADMVLAWMPYCGPKEWRGEPDAKEE